MENALVYRFKSILLALVLVAAGVTLPLRAEELHLADNQVITGEIVSMDEKGVVLKLTDGTYGDKIPWGKLSQASLKEMDENPKAAAFVEPFIIPVQQDRAKRTEVEIKDYPKLARPAKQSLFAALFGSALGVLIVLVVYGANIYAGYEVAIYRGRPKGLVCGVSAVLPVIGPIIFLCLPTIVKKKEETWQQAAEQQLEPGLQEAIAAEAQAEAEAQAAAAAAAAAAAEPVVPVIKLPPTKTYARGQYTFNRRFLDSQFNAYTAMSRPESEKDMVMTVKAARGTYEVGRISNLSVNDMTVQVHKGNAFEDVVIPYIEIQEIQLKHRDAK